MADIADRFDNLQIGDWPEPAPAAATPPPEPTPVAEPPAPVDVPETGVEPGNEVATQENPPPWVLPDLPALPTFSALGDWRDPSEDPPDGGDDDETVGQWREVKDLPGIWQPAPQTMTNQLWQEYVGRGYRDHADNLPDVGQQIDAGLPSVGQVRSGLTHAGSAGRTAPRTGGFSLPDFDLFGGLFSGLAGLGLFLDGLIGLFSLSWLLGPSKAPAVQLTLYAVPLELGVMVHNALVNRGVRATAVRFAVAGDEVMSEFFFNVPEPQEWLTENIMRSAKVMWRKVDG